MLQHLTKPRFSDLARTFRQQISARCTERCDRERGGCAEYTRSAGVVQGIEYLYHHFLVFCAAWTLTPILIEAKHCVLDQCKAIFDLDGGSGLSPAWINVLRTLVPPFARRVGLNCTNTSRRVSGQRTALPAVRHFVASHMRIQRGYVTNSGKTENRET